MSDRPEPKFKVGQRVYHRLNPVHGKIVKEVYEDGQWMITVQVDKPNPHEKMGLHQIGGPEKGFSDQPVEGLGNPDLRIKLD